MGARDIAIDSINVHCRTLVNTIGTAASNVVGERHVVRDGVVDRFDSVRVVDGKYRIVRCLDLLADNTIADSQRVHDELCAICLSSFDEVILRLEIVEENWTVVPAIPIVVSYLLLLYRASILRFRPQIKILDTNARIEMRKIAEEALENLPSPDSCQCRSVNGKFVDYGIASSRWLPGSIGRIAGRLVDSAHKLLGVRKSYPDRL